MCKALDFQKGPVGRRLTDSFVNIAMIENISQNNSNT